jgi:hypothetical protein
MKRSSLLNRVSKFMPKKFYEIDPQIGKTMLFKRIAEKEIRISLYKRLRQQAWK